MLHYLLVDELSGVFLNMAFVEICRHVHQTNLGEAKIRQLNVPH